MATLIKQGTGIWKVGNNVFAIRNYSYLLYSALTQTFSTPTGLAIHGNFLYVVNNGVNTVSVIDLTTRLTTATITGFSGPQFMTIDTVNNRAFVVNGTNSTVAVVNLTTNVISSTISGFNAPRGIAIDYAGDRVFVSNNTGSTLSIFSLSALTMLSPFNSAEVNNGQGLAIDLVYNRLFLCTVSTNVKVINLSTMAVTNLAIGSTGMRGVTIDVPNNRAFATDNTGNILKVIDLSTLSVSTMTTGLTSAYGVVMDYANSRIFVSLLGGFVSTLQRMAS